jgi:hypothetical protein
VALNIKMSVTPQAWIDMNAPLRRRTPEQLNQTLKEVVGQIKDLREDQRVWLISAVIDTFEEIPKGSKPRTTFKKVKTPITHRQLQDFNSAAQARHRSVIKKSAAHAGRAMKSQPR